MRCIICVLLVGSCLFGLHSQQIYYPHEEEKKTKITGHPILMYTPETSWIFGAAGILLINNYDSTSFHQNPSIINPFFFFSLNKQFWLVTRAELYHKNHLTNARIEAGKVPDYFYGKGMNTTPDNQKYTMQTYGVHYEWLTYFSRRHIVGFKSRINYNKISDIEPGTIITGQIAGLEAGYTGEIGPSYLYDSRDDIIYPRKGWYAKSSITYFPGFFKGNYSIASVEFDIRKYITLVNHKNTVALQVVNRYLLGDNIPFYELNQLGGEKRLRGIHANRYIDRHLFFTQLEYRRDLPLFFGIAAFAGTGLVYDTFSDYNLQNLVFNYGLGLRINLIPEENVNFRIDVGMGSNGENGFYVGIQEVF